jgi:23S rRNA pseudouridine1911/1915/1917 synthase
MAGNEDLLQEPNEESQELYEHHRFEVDKRQEPVRIDKFIVMRLSGVSRTRIQYAAEAGNIRANNKPVKSNYKIRPGEVISVVLPFSPVEFDLSPQDIPIVVEYEDEDILIVNKQPGMVVHPGKSNYNGTLVNALLYYFKDEPGFIDGTARPGLVHRIDKDTSGLMVIAKNEKALNKLALQFFEHTCKRSYQAIVWGLFEEKKGTIAGHIGRSLHDRTRMQIFPDGSLGRHAVTHYTVLEELGYVSLIECRLETGRTHQIRTHMSWKDHPIFNDSVYGGNKIIKGPRFSKYEQFIKNCFEILPRQALHAKSLGFIHPGTGREVFFESQLPDDMQAFLTKWKKWWEARNETE